jgi:hypothetical protein
VEHHHVPFEKRDAMKKLSLAIGAAVGFLAGSRAGRGPYTKLQSKARAALARRPDVRKVVDDTSDAVQEKLHDVESAAAEKMEKIHHIKAS